MYDFHMHSDFSADCSIPMEEMIQGAIKKGLKEICFTEHIDYEYPDPDYVFEFDLLAYDKKIRTLQDTYADQITIRKGIELGLQPYLIDRYQTLMDEESFDFALCSIHSVDRKDLHSRSLFTDYEIAEAYQLYYDELLYCVENFKSYSVLGHLDLIKRYTLGQEPYDLYHEVIAEIFKIIIPEGKGIELNTSGERDGLPSGMPSRDILELYKDLGGEIITLGSDAHEPSALGFDFEKSRDLLRDIGFTYLASFSKQEPTFHPLADLNF